jgi:hypothetical protein
MQELQVVSVPLPRYTAIALTPVKRDRSPWLRQATDNVASQDVAGRQYNGAGPLGSMMLA